jgi:adenylate kinase family enzyme
VTPPRRIAVIGCGGSGKSTLARALGERRGLPVVHLDLLYWKPGFVASDEEDFVSAQRKLVAGDSWVLDGNYGGTMEIRLATADMVVFLDTPTAVSLLRVLRRQLAGMVLGRSHLGPDYPERLSLEFLSYVAGYRRTRRPRILERCPDSRARSSSSARRAPRAGGSSRSTLPPA